MKVRLYQLALRVRDHEPDGAPYATEAEASSALATAAREHLEVLLDLDPELTLNTMLDYADMEPAMGLDDLDDADLIKVAKAWDGEPFDCAIYPVDVEIPEEMLR